MAQVNDNHPRSAQVSTDRADADDLALLLGRRVSVWWPRLRTFLHGELTEYRQASRSFVCAYDGEMGVDHYLMVHEHREENQKGDGPDVVSITDHYLLDFPEDWKPSRRDNQHRAAMLGEPVRLTRCGRCEGCTSNGAITQQACHSIRATILAHYGHYGSFVSSLAAAAVGRRTSKFSVSRDRYHEGFITDWNPFTWKHQIMYDDGAVEDTVLYLDRIRKPGGNSWSVLEPRELAWLPPGQNLQQFCGQGRFQSRELGANAINQPALIYGPTSAGRRGWRPCQLTAFFEASQTHVVTYTDAQSPSTAVVDHDNQVVMLLSRPVPVNLFSAPPTSTVSGEAGAEITAQASTPLVSSSHGSDHKRAKTGVSGAQRQGEVPEGTLGSGSRPEAVTAETTGSEADNPLMQSRADYHQIMRWVSEFLRYDKRVPSDAQKLMAVHEEVQKGQVKMGLHTTAPDKFYGHAFTAMGMVPNAWRDDFLATAAIKSAPAEMRAGFQCSQGLINTLFRQTPGASEDTQRSNVPVAERPLNHDAQDANVASEAETNAAVKRPS